MSTAPSSGDRIREAARKAAQALPPVSAAGAARLAILLAPTEEEAERDGAA